jgi:hypothetical protein
MAEETVSKTWSQVQSRVCGGLRLRRSGEKNAGRNTTQDKLQRFARSRFKSSIESYSQDTALKVAQEPVVEPISDTGVVFVKSTDVKSAQVKNRGGKGRRKGCYSR